MLNDEWTLEDKLGHKVVTDQIIKTLEQVEPPFTLGIYGGWGSGKTSIMRQVYYRIGGCRKTLFFKFDENPYRESISEGNIKIINKMNPGESFEAVWFNPWKHENESNPILGLLHEIRDNFDLYSKISEEANKIANVSIRTGLDVLSSAIKAMTKIDIRPSSIEGHGLSYEENNFSVCSQSQSFRIIFESAIHKLIGKDKKLIIFIDDLDRCSDSRILSLLEGIKLYLSTSNCIFVFGMDQANVLRALKEENVHKDYLDKLFQSVLRIPLSQKFEANFISDLVSLSFKELTDPKQKKAYVRMLSEILENNPRKIKNFINSLKFHWSIRGDNTLELEQFTLFHYVRNYFEEIFEVLEQDPTQFKAFVNACNKDFPNNKAESYFQLILSNPIMEAIGDIEADENEKYTTVLNESDYIALDKTRTNFKSLDSFKSYFSEKCGEISEVLVIEKYLGVLKS